MRFSYFFLHACLHCGSSHETVHPLNGGGGGVIGWKFFPFPFGQRLSESLSCEVKELWRELKIFLSWEEAFTPMRRPRRLLVGLVARGTGSHVLGRRLLWSNQTSRRKESSQNGRNSLCNRLFYPLVQLRWRDFRRMDRSRLTHIVLEDNRGGQWHMPLA